MATTTALTNSAAMLSVPSDFSIFIALTAAFTFSPGICWQLSCWLPTSAVVVSV